MFRRAASFPDGKVRATDASQCLDLLDRYSEPSPRQSCPTYGDACPGCPDCWPTEPGVQTPARAAR